MVRAVVTNIAYFNKKHVFTRAEPLLCLWLVNPLTLTPYTMYHVNRATLNCCNSTAGDHSNIL